MHVIYLNKEIEFLKAKEEALVVREFLDIKELEGDEKIF